MNLSPETMAAVVLLGPASLGQLWCAERVHRVDPAALPRALRRMRATNRLMAVALLTNLLLGTLATLLWAEASIGSSAVQTSPPLLWPLILFVAGVLVSIVSNSVAAHRPAPHPAAPPGPFTGAEERRALRAVRALRPVRRAVR